MVINGNLKFHTPSVTPGKSELQNAVMERLAGGAEGASLPSSGAVAGRLVFNTDDASYWYHNGSVWVKFGTGGNIASLQTEVDNIETTLGTLVNANGTTNVAAALTNSYFGGATNLTTALQNLASAVTGKDALSELLDVDVSGVVDGQFLRYSAGSPSKWVDHTLVLANVTDVTVPVATLNGFDSRITEVEGDFTQINTWLGRADEQTQPVWTSVVGPVNADHDVVEAVSAIDLYVSNLNTTVNSLMLDDLVDVVASTGAKTIGDFYALRVSGGIGSPVTDAVYTVDHLHLNDLNDVTDAGSAGAILVKTASDAWTARSHVSGTGDNSVGAGGTGVQAWDVDLAEIAACNNVSGNILYTNGSDVWVCGAPGQTSGVQPWDADLVTIAGFNPGAAVTHPVNGTSQRYIIVSTSDGGDGSPPGTQWEIVQGADARNSLGLGDIATHDDHEYVRVDGTNVMEANLNLATYNIVNVANPTQAQDAATKSYVDALASGLTWLDPFDGTNAYGDDVPDPSSGSPLEEHLGVGYILPSDASGIFTGLGGWYVEYQGALGDPVMAIGGSPASGWYKVVNLVTEAADHDVYIGIAHEEPTADVQSGNLASKQGKYLKITKGTITTFGTAANGALGTGFDGTVTYYTPEPGDTYFVNNAYSYHYGEQKTFKSTYFTGSPPVAAYNEATCGTDGDNYWLQSAGGSKINAGIGLSYSGTTMNVNLGAGIVELPGDEVGIELYDPDTSALILTTDATTRSTVTNAKLHLLLNSSQFVQGIGGLGLASGGITLTEIDPDVWGCGLTTAGSPGGVLSVALDDGAGLECTIGGLVSLTNGGVPIEKLAAYTYGFVGNDGGSPSGDTAELGQTFTFASGSGNTGESIPLLEFNVAADTITINPRIATTTDLGVAMYSSTFFTVDATGLVEIVESSVGQWKAGADTGDDVIVNASRTVEWTGANGTATGASEYLTTAVAAGSSPADAIVTYSLNNYRSAYNGDGPGTFDWDLGDNLAFAGANGIQVTTALAGSPDVGTITATLTAGLSNLSDVYDSIAGTTGNVLYKHATNGWTNGALGTLASQAGGIGIALDNLNDVNTSGVADGHVLIKSSTSSGEGTWKTAKIYHVHTQSASSDTWTVTHNLNQKYCNVTIVDSADQVIIPQSITFGDGGSPEDINTLTVTFNAAITGRCVVMGVGIPA